MNRAAHALFVLGAHKGLAHVSAETTARRDRALPVRCDTHVALTTTMPTKRRRHSITETPAVQAALDKLRAALGTRAGGVG